MTSAAQPSVSAGTSSSSLPAAGAALADLSCLTEKQRAVYELKLSGKTLPEIGVIRGLSRATVSKYLQVCYKKLGITKKQGPQPNQGLDYKDPERAAAAIEAAADPMAATQKEALERVNAQLKAAGVPDRVSEALLRRLRVKYANAVFAARELRTGEILEMLGKKIDLAAFYLDDKVLSEASARDIMLGLGVMIEKRNLLRGEPTAIISDHERKKLHELLPALLAEAKRRGAVTFDEKGAVIEPR